jgi:hypothetical protein
VTSRVAAGRVASFFAGAAFHRAVQERGSLAAAFGEHLAAGGTPLVRALAAVETAVARVRRAPRTPAPSPAGTLRRTPAAAVVVVPAGSLRCYETLRAGGPPAALAPGDEPLLVVRPGADSAVTIEHAPVALATLLDGATAPQPRAALLAAARRLGAEGGEDVDVVDGLIRDGLLL